MDELQISNLVFSQQENVLQLQKQIRKDFELFHEHFPADFLQQSYTKEEILQFIHQNLVPAFEKGERFVLQLVYKIDLPEKDFLKIVAKTNVAEELSNLILKKEMTKIYFRLFYK